jgi:hypothetical protein
MKVLISILIVVGVIFAVYKGYDYWERVNQEKELNEKAQQGQDIDPTQLSGMPWQIEQKYREASQKGAPGLKAFLEAYSKSPSFKDPRKAWIELDYMVMISGSDPLEAKKIFAEVKGRVSTNSVIYPRIRSLAKTYE